MAEANSRRLAMVERLTRAGTVRTDAIERALREVARHVFLPDRSLRTAYDDRAVIAKRAKDGTAISSASQPTMVAAMLEQLDVQPGQRVLEVGTGTGYNAALLSVLAGEKGLVTTVELDAELARLAAQRLSRIAANRIEVVTGDGRLGYPANAPYHRIVVTAGSAKVEPAWADQLADDGRMVVPIVDRRGVGTVVLFVERSGTLIRGPEIPCGFLLMRNPPNL